MAQLGNGRFDVALFDVGSFDEQPIAFENPYSVEKHLGRARTATLVRGDEVKLKRQAAPTLVRRQE